MATPGKVADTLVSLLSEELAGMDDVGRRIVCNRLQSFMQAFVLGKPAETPPAAAPPLDVPAMTEAQAAAYGRTQWSFGKYSGQQVSQIPISYLTWLADSSLSTWKALRGYLKSSIGIQRRETEPQRKPWQRAATRDEPDDFDDVEEDDEWGGPPF